MIRRRHLLGLLALSMRPVMPHRAFAQPPYPNRPLRLVIPFPPGGGYDAPPRALPRSQFSSRNSEATTSPPFNMLPWSPFVTGPAWISAPLSSRGPGTVTGRSGQRSGHQTPMRRTIGASEHRRKCASRKQGGADEASPQGDPERRAIRFRDQREETIMELCRSALRRLGAALIIGLGFISGASAQSGNPIRIGMSLALTGAGAAPSKVINTALEIWRDDVNAKGGLLGRPVELVVYDDQSAPANVPNIYTKLITVDKVDLLLGPYGTNFVAPAMPTIIQNNKLTISFTAIGINDKFHYPKYFSMVSVGPEGVDSFSIGFFDMAAAQQPQPQTVAILAADAEFAQSAAAGARNQIKRHGFKLVYDQSYPPNTTDFAPVVRAVRATNPDIVYIGAYPPDNVGIIRAANEIGLAPKMMGGAMIGMLVTPMKVQLGPIANGLITGENFAAAMTKQIAGATDFLTRYGEKAVAARIDPFGFAWGPFAYSAGQVLAQAVTETKSLDHDKLAEYMHKASFKTVSGDFSFGKDGEWSKSRMFWTQVQNAQPNNLDQFRDGTAQPIVWPPEARTGTLIYPYEKARQK